MRIKAAALGGSPCRTPAVPSPAPRHSQPPGQRRPCHGPSHPAGKGSAQRAEGTSRRRFRAWLPAFPPSPPAHAPGRRPLPRPAPGPGGGSAPAVRERRLPGRGCSAAPPPPGPARRARPPNRPRPRRPRRPSLPRRPRPAPHTGLGWAGSGGSVVAVAGVTLHRRRVHRITESLSSEKTVEIIESNDVQSFLKHIQRG